ncbi:protoporphyrinogen oxidase HemJ [Sediminicurvatus halobius]|uniref:Protoporphyrinogen IX oxidase n=1 Tax=Sediminicurvatus halobius TaxID=2182432 RepID=A0A2U2N0N1_9GAMM|nr:protoporphyrinogen oxidase HemJ [Spiribacter halobius]UEX79918.1 protoporphyrinogen oxidase HemJ [Spiribacter halobius]
MLWVKAFHIIFVVTWFAALFYLPRLFVYHAMAEDETGRERFKVMERKLYRGIMNPSAVLAVGLGVWLLWLAPWWLQEGWLHAKIALVALLVGYHLYCGRLLRAFAEERNRHGHVWYRVFNELPVLVLVAVVILVVVKPF